MEFNRSQRVELQNALEKTFSVFELRKILSNEFDIDLSAIIIANNKAEIFFEVVNYMQSRGELIKLFEAAINDKPKNSLLLKIKEEKKILKRNTDDDFTNTTDSNFEKHSPEAMINHKNDFIDIEVRNKRLDERQFQVCKIVEPYGAHGTGFLISADLIMTNFHVISNLYNKKYEKEKIHCLFDYKVLLDLDTDTEKISLGTKYDLHENWLVDKDEGLDYAIIRLKDAIGEEPICEKNKRKRGWIKLKEKVEVKIGDQLMIVQHPAGGPLKLGVDMEAVTKITDSVVHYSTNTIGGSSGSPCFDKNLKITALHCAGPKDNDCVLRGIKNQGKRMSVICEKMIKNGYGYIIDGNPYNAVLSTDTIDKIKVGWENIDESIQKVKKLLSTKEK